jgi:ABC-type multidrug transport system ATPase subunit
MAAIEAEELRRTHKTHTGTLRRKAKEIEAVRGISFAVEPGELFGLLGPNGAGKTTTINRIAVISKGNIVAEGSPLDLKRGIGHGTVVEVEVFGIAGEAARKLAAGASLGGVKGLLGAELLVGVIYGVGGYPLLRWFETLSRRHASLERW